MLVLLLRVLVAVAVPLATFSLLWWTFEFLRDENANRFIVVGVAIVVGVGGVFFLFWGDQPARRPDVERYREKVRPYVFIGPALVLLAVFLVYPVINTLVLSFLKDSNSQQFVGLDNYEFLFTDEDMLTAIRNTAGWLILVPLAAVQTIGLAFATLADRLRRGEAVAKSLIFLPIAISFAGASITWQLVYSYRPQGFGSEHRPAQRHRAGAGERSRQVAGAPALEQPAADGDHGLDADRVRHGRAVGGHQWRSPTTSSRPRAWTAPPSGRCSARSSRR